MNDVTAGRVRNRVIAGTAKEVVVAATAVDEVIATVSPDGVVIGMAGHKPVVTFRAAKNDRVAKEVVIADEVHRAIRQLFNQKRSGHRILQPRVLVKCDQSGFNRIFRRHEDRGRNMLGTRGADDQRRKRVALDLGAKVHAFYARQIVKPVGILQRLKLGFEDEIERRTKQAAKQVLLFRKAADPQVHIVKTRDVARTPLRMDSDGAQHISCIGIYAVHEVIGVMGKRADGLQGAGRVNAEAD